MEICQESTLFSQPNCQEKTVITCLSSWCDGGERTAESDEQHVG